MKFFNKGNWMILFILLMTLGTAFVTIAIEYLFVLNDLDEPGNQSTIIIEIAVGIIIAFIVHRKTSEQQQDLNDAIKEIRELASEIKKIEEKQVKTIEKEKFDINKQKNQIYLEIFKSLLGLSFLTNMACEELEKNKKSELPIRRFAAEFYLKMISHKYGQYMQLVNTYGQQLEVEEFDTIFTLDSYHNTNMKSLKIDPINQTLWNSINSGVDSLKDLIYAKVEKMIEIDNSIEFQVYLEQKNKSANTLDSEI